MTVDRISRFRFSLRTFLIVCILPVPVLAWMASVKLSAMQQRAAANHLEARAVVHVSFESPTPNLINTFFRSFIDEDAFDRATVAARYYREFQPGEKDILTREDIDAILKLRELRDLDLIVRNPHLINESPTPILNLPVSEIARLTHIPTLARFTIDADLDRESQLRLARLPELHSLALPGAKISDEVLDLLVQNPNIAYLEFDARKLSRDSFSKLNEFPRLQSLTLHHLPQETGFLENLSSCEALGQLELSHSKVRRSDAKVINGMRLQALHLNYCEVEPGFFADLTHSKTLVSVLARTTLRSAILHKRPFTASIEPDRLQELEDHFTTNSAASSKDNKTKSP